jgi:cysteine synthase
MVNGMVIGSGGTIVTTSRGLKAFEGKGIAAEAADLEGSLFYRAPEGL